MPAPQFVSHSQFTNQRILYDNGAFSVAAGNYAEAGITEFALGMRWNGTETSPGYPHVVNNPVWFIVTPELIVPILNALQQFPQANREEISATIQRLSQQET